MMIQLMTRTNRTSTVMISMGDYLASMRVITKLCRVTMVTMHMMVSMKIFKL